MHFWDPVHPRLWLFDLPCALLFFFFSFFFVLCPVLCPLPRPLLELRLFSCFFLPLSLWSLRPCSVHVVGTISNIACGKDAKLSRGDTNAQEARLYHFFCVYVYLYYFCA